jgi:hypothetical protein
VCIHKAAKTRLFVLVEISKLIVARMCRKGQQANVVKVYIIADPNFIGDREALRIKKDRAREDHDMSRPFNKTIGDFEVFDSIEK